MVTVGYITCIYVYMYICRVVQCNAHQLQPKPISGTLCSSHLSNARILCEGGTCVRLKRAAPWMDMHAEGNAYMAGPNNTLKEEEVCLIRRGQFDC